MRWAILIFVIVFGGGVILLVVSKDKIVPKNNIIQQEKRIVEPPITTMSYTENIPIVESSKTYDFLKLETLGPVCLNLYKSSKVTDLLENLDKNSCTQNTMSNSEKLLIKALLYERTNKKDSELEVLDNVIKSYNVDPIVSSNREKLLCRKIEISNQDIKYQIVADTILANEQFSCIDKNLILQSANHFYEKKEEFTSRRLYSKIYLQLDEKTKQEVLKKIKELNDKIIFSANIYPDSFQYVVAKGDILLKIGKKFSISAELIKKINRLKSDMIYPGQRLKILKTDNDKKFKILVKKSIHKLYLFWGEDIVDEYIVSTGVIDVSPTPEGIFKITNKLTEPTWKGIPFGDPANILGTRWMGFNEPYANYGIHGTTHPETIGQDVTNGCIRMLNQDVENLFDFITEETEVVIEK